MRVITILPLVGIKTLKLRDGVDQLANGFTIAARDKLRVLSEFEKEGFIDRFGNDLSKALYADYHLQVEKEFGSEQIRGGTATETGAGENSEKLDRFLLAVNINERLWLLRPHLFLSWNEEAGSIAIKTISKRDFYPFPTSRVNPTYEDFHEAARLTAQIDQIYEENKNRGSYPAFKIAFDSLRLSVLTFSGAIRFLQEMICLETICSTDRTEIAHRVALVCALLLGSTFSERENLYKEVKKLYDKRSSIIHGAHNRVEADELVQIENMSRRLLRKVLHEEIVSRFANRQEQKKFLMEIQLNHGLRS